MGQQLLKRDMWFCMFYVHLIVLYTIVASCMAARTTGNPGYKLEVSMQQKVPGKISGMVAAPSSTAFSGAATSSGSGLRGASLESPLSDANASKPPRRLTNRS